MSAGIITHRDTLPSHVVGPPEMNFTACSAPSHVKHSTSSTISGPLTALHLPSLALKFEMICVLSFSPTTVIYRGTQFETSPASPHRKLFFSAYVSHVATARTPMEPHMLRHTGHATKHRYAFKKRRANPELLPDHSPHNLCTAAAPSNHRVHARTLLCS